MSQGKKSFIVIGLLMALVFAGGCGDVKDQVSGVMKDLAAQVGKEVASLDLVNVELVQEASKLIAVLQEMKMNLTYNENGIQFSGKDINGTVGLNGDTMFLDVRSSAKDGNAIQTMVRMANVFSPDNTIEDRLNAAQGVAQVQTYQLNNGYIEAGPDYLFLHLETYLQ